MFRKEHMQKNCSLKTCVLMAVAIPAAAVHADGIDYDLGADLRIRQEIMQHVPGLPGDSEHPGAGTGRLSPVRRGNYKNHMRFRPRVWGEVKGESESLGAWRLYTRLTDEFRWYVTPRDGDWTWPDEVVLDNLFIEGKDLFDGFLDLSVGRQDMYNNLTGGQSAPRERGEPRQRGE